MIGPVEGHAARYARLIDRFVAWANTRDDVAAAIIVGSRSRTDHPADEWSDLDLVMFAADPPVLLEDPGWLAHMGEASISFREPTAVGIWEERRVLFKDGCDVDFSILPAELLDPLRVMRPGDPLYEEAGAVIARGYWVILDKEGELAEALGHAASFGMPAPPAPTQERFDQLFSDFWYHCPWAARKLARGEIIVAHQTLDGYLRGLLLQFIHWSAERNGATWHESRFFNEWAPSPAREMLPETWARHDAGDIRRALEVAMDLASFLEAEIASGYGFTRDEGPEQAARQWVAVALDHLGRRA
jgi:aminoglycoside 6-adenylyltransferase